ncbi:hypothetical protein VN97_g2160 [Penicillium thymicola]|uniref:Uncharacterized protein n=1 Tax=Penicillium thymicola TaxID=293382 RepID=A0AAI9XBD9_PENTH|nr:hypothetical protein VN97_g2160 [Penicillium thymicola]
MVKIKKMGYLTEILRSCDMEKQHCRIRLCVDGRRGEGEKERERDYIKWICHMWGICLRHPGTQQYLFQRIAVPTGVYLGGFRYEEMKIYMNIESYRKYRILVKCYMVLR